MYWQNYSTVTLFKAKGVQYVHLEKADFRFFKVPSGTCFRSCFGKSCEQRASTASSNQVFPRRNLKNCGPAHSDF